VSRPFVFADRDGTLVRDAGYVYRVEDYERLPGAAEGLARLQAAGYGIAIVTNQSGIGRGYFGESDFARFQEHLVADFAAHGVTIEASLHCPHLPDAGCGCRKPAPGLLERARVELAADLARSWVIGDSPSDAELARCVGARAVHVLTGHGVARRAEIPPDVPVVADLQAAADCVLSSS
jgi:histidinol-phosphate phosphatase family protein